MLADFEELGQRLGGGDQEAATGDRDLHPEAVEGDDLQHAADAGDVVEEADIVGAREGRFSTTTLPAQLAGRGRFLGVFR